MTMEKKINKYASPAIEVIDFRSEGVICGSQGSQGGGLPGGHGSGSDAPACFFGIGA